MTNLTLIMPTYNRPAMLERCLLHFNLDETDLPIIVADGSSAEARAENARNIASLGKDLNITHLVYPPDLGFAARCAAVLAEVTSPMVAFHADDDFMFADGLKSVAQALQGRSDLVAAQGTMLLVRRSDPAVRIMPYVYQDVTQNGPLTRLAWHMRSYRPTFYSVHRTASARAAFDAIGPFGDWWPRMIEIGLSSMIAVQGKFAHVEEMQGVRETHAQSDSSRDHNWPQIVVDPRFSSVLDSYAATITSAAAQQPDAQSDKPQSTADRDAAVRAAFLEFIKCALVPAHRPKVPSLIRQSWAIHDLFAENRITPRRREALKTIFASLTT